MIDLDALEELTNDSEASTDHRLYVALAARLCKGTLTYLDFQRLSKWLGVYYYVLPLERVVLDDLRDELYRRHRDRLYALALLVTHVEANLTATHQALLLEKLKDLRRKTPARLPDSPENVLY